MKQVVDYTDAELIEIGKKTVASGIKSAVKDKERKAIFNKVMAAIASGELKMPK